ncbi:unnamed protein product [Miscanthus lutarioriparius]|uniref:Uncharacterized protein n=1 Tax=Miscanthus lutarioriparius TaxID=422564 RepID=A0A811N3A6_9POAL|nr:unnamed protein product [Miscanthus lutarioriparius]
MCSEQALKVLEVGKLNRVKGLWKEFLLTLLRGQPVICVSRVLVALKEQGNKLQAEGVNNLQNYLEEPEGQYLIQQLVSKELFM